MGDSKPIRIEACLIVSPGPGIAILLKIATIPSASQAVIVKLLRRALTIYQLEVIMPTMVCLDTDKLMGAENSLGWSSNPVALVMGKGIIMAGFY